MVKLTPWMEEGAWNLLTQIGSCGVLWILSIISVLPLLNGDNQGGYGVVRKVRIEFFFASQAQLNWWGRHRRQMTIKKHVSNN
jgi:hypothetical protein